MLINGAEPLGYPGRNIMRIPASHDNPPSMPEHPHNSRGIKNLNMRVNRKILGRPCIGILFSSWGRGVGIY